MWTTRDRLIILIFLSAQLIDSTSGDQLDVHEILNLESPGGIGCVLKIHSKVEECKQDYEQRVKQKEDDGHTSESETYRQEVCCGFWSLRDCVAKSAREQCDEKSARLIENMKIYQPDSANENKLIKKCAGYEYGSSQCDSANFSAHFTIWTLITNLVIITIINYLL